MNFIPAGNEPDDCAVTGRMPQGSNIFPGRKPAAESQKNRKKQKKSCKFVRAVLRYLPLTNKCLWNKDTMERFPGFCEIKEAGVRVRQKEATQYFVVREKAIPEVLLKVVEAKRLLETERVLTIQEAVDAVGISRSSFYKYKDDIFQFHDNSQGTTFTLTFQMDDEPGILSDVLKIIAEFRANILTIHQSIPINGIASLSLSIQVLQATGDVSEMLEQMERTKGVHHVKILAKE